MPAPVLIRPATVADLTEVAAIFAGYVRDSVVTFELDPPGLRVWEERLDQLAGAGWPFLVATIEHQLAGYAYVAPWRTKPAYRHTVEDSVYLAPAWAGRGVGRVLLRALIDAATAAGARQMMAMISDTGDGASTALHRRLGFAPVGRLTSVGYKHGRWIDVQLLQRSLGRGADTDPDPA